MRFTLASVLAAATLIGSSIARPTAGSKLQIVKTTTTAKGQVIDWVLPGSQGKIASPPTAPPSNIKPGHFQPASVNLIPNDPAHKGPAGTVPILRTNSTSGLKKLPEAASSSSVYAEDTSYSGQHWYASSGQAVNNKGGQATVSLYKAFVESSSDFSLIQTAVIYDVNNLMQTVETGWINYPNQVSEPHLFSFYTTNGYSQNGDNIGGWNTEVKGWVQVDSSIYPGIPFTPLSTDGGDQYEMQIGYQLQNDGNWWLWVIDRYIGYYPGSLFGSTSSSLAGGSTQIDWYGEIYNSETTLTTTDMGSGEFPQAGFGKSAYLHNIVYYDTGLNTQNYDGSSQIVVSDDTRYNIVPTWNSGSTWGSYFYLGGPGAGSNIGS